MVVSDNHCVVHDWWLEDGELCPVCEGILLERERVVGLLELLRGEYRAMMSPDDADVVNVCLDVIRGDV